MEAATIRRPCQHGYAGHVNMATDAREDLPEVDPTALLAENEATLAAIVIEAEAALATKAGPGPRDDPAAKGGKNAAVAGHGRRRPGRG